MKKYLINGNKRLSGEVSVGGSKNSALKLLIAACLTDEEVEIKNIPLISDLFIMTDLIREIGGEVELDDHRVKVRLKELKSYKIPLETGAKIRTSSMFLAPLLARSGQALIPNPGGCRIGARPIDRHIEGLERMNAKINYFSEDGYFHATTDGLVGADYKFEKNTHTGTETLILAAVLARGKTVLENAALEPEIDDLIEMLNKMGGKIKREEGRKIIIEGVEKLHGTSFEIMPDRNEIVTFAIASALTGGQIWIKNSNLPMIQVFLDKFQEAGGKWEEKNGMVRFYFDGPIKPVDIVTNPHPGFMTDWQGPWAVLMTQAEGVSSIHETIYEYRFNYVQELIKMGAKIKSFVPKVENPKEFYNFNYYDGEKYDHAIKIMGKTSLHNAVLTISDLRAGATLVLASLLADGESVIYGIEHLERGYEFFDKRLRGLGAEISEEEDIEAEDIYVAE